MNRQEVSCWLHPIRFSDVRVGNVHAGQNDGDADSLHQGKGLAQQGHAGDDGYDGGNADERRRAVYTDAGDGHVGQEKGQDGTADALIQDGSEEGGVGQGQAQAIGQRFRIPSFGESQGNKYGRAGRHHGRRKLCPRVSRGLFDRDAVQGIRQDGNRQDGVAGKRKARRRTGCQNCREDAGQGHGNADDLMLLRRFIQQQRRGQERHGGNAGQKGAAFRGRRPADAYGLGDKIDDGITESYGQERLSWLPFPAHLHPSRRNAQGHERRGDEKTPSQQCQGAGSLRRLLGTDIAQAEQGFAADGTETAP